MENVKSVLLSYKRNKNKQKLNFRVEVASFLNGQMEIAGAHNVVSMMRDFLHPADCHELLELMRGQGSVVKLNDGRKSQLIAIPILITGVSKKTNLLVLSDTDIRKIESSFDRHGVLANGMSLSIARQLVSHNDLPVVPSVQMMVANYMADNGPVVDLPLEMADSVYVDKHKEGSFSFAYVLLVMTAPKSMDVPVFDEWNNIPELLDVIEYSCQNLIRDAGIFVSSFFSPMHALLSTCLISWLKLFERAIWQMMDGYPTIENGEHFSIQWQVFDFQGVLVQFVLDGITIRQLQLNFPTNPLMCIGDCELLLSDFVEQVEILLNQNLPEALIFHSGAVQLH